MNILVTAGNTRIFIDKVRCLTNIFTGRTGAGIALEACRRGHEVVLLTSHPEAVLELAGQAALPADRWRQLRYDTLDDLARLMERHIKDEAFDAVIHSAAVSDYLAGGAFAPAPGTRLRDDLTWQADAGKNPTLVDRAAGKIKSDDAELWLRLVRAPKLIDLVRSAWGFRGRLVKFKLEVGVDDKQLLDIAEESRVHSQANLMVANTLEGAATWAFLGPVAGEYARVSRRELPEKVLDAVERLR
jgi:phosphopantothenoylcysteine synthetase/decarboxylase